MGGRATIRTCRRVETLERTMLPSSASEPTSSWSDSSTNSGKSSVHFRLSYRDPYPAGVGAAGEEHGGREDDQTRNAGRKVSGGAMQTKLAKFTALRGRCARRPRP